MPKRLMFLIDPTDRILAVKAAPAGTRGQTVTVSANFFAGMDSCDTYSKRLMGMIRKLCGQDVRDGTYTAIGHFEAKDRVVWFPIEHARLRKEDDHAAEI